jgi:hypothetical protein
MFQHISPVTPVQPLQGEYLCRSSSPVLDVSFPAAKARSVDSECDGLEPSPFSSPNKLLHHLPVLVDLQRFMAIDKFSGYSG